MDKSITETLRKINMELRGANFLSIFLSLILLTTFTGYKIFTSSQIRETQEMSYIKSNFISQNSNQNTKNSHFIYASIRGKKYYYYNCKSTIKEANKIYFDSDAAALKAGYTLAAACK